MFIDSKPEYALYNTGYTPYVFRLYLNPSVNESPPSLKTSKNLQANGIKWKINDTANGYAVEIAIPWLNLGLKQPGYIAFDIAVDDNDGGHRKTQMLWSGTASNHKSRNRFGLLKINNID